MPDDEDNERIFGLDATRYDDTEQLYRSRDDEAVESEDSADEIDPKKLVRNPSLNDIRWYYRNGPFGKPIVNRPVNDAFKHGYDIPDNSDARQFIEHIEDQFKSGERKGRRDGMALLWFRLKDANKEWEPPKNVNEIRDVRVLTVDDLTDTLPNDFEEKLVDADEDIPTPTEPPKSYDPEDEEPPYSRTNYYEVTDDGVVISKVYDSDRFERPVSYLYDMGTGFQPLMIHHERVLPLVWRTDVDGNVEEVTWGNIEGDPVLKPIIHVLRGVHKGNWAIAQRLFRHSAPLHVMEVPEGADDDEYDKAESVGRNINAKSYITEPPGFELRTVENEANANVEESFDVLFNQICANTEFTKSVLFGTQAGTVSGSEVDIKNYFSKIQKLRHNRYEEKLHEAVSMAAEWDISGDGWDSVDDDDFTMEWGPLFKLNRLERAEAMRTQVNMISQAMGNYVVSQDEARSLMDEQWVDWTDVDFDGSLSEEQMDLLDRINVGRFEQTEGSQEDEYERGNPRVGNSDEEGNGGMEQGQSTSSSNPTADSASGD